LEQRAFNSTIEGDLRLTLNEALDKLVLDAIAASGFQAPATDPLLVSIRKATTTVQAAGYSPDTLVLRPRTPRRLTRCAPPPRPASSTTSSRPRSSRPGRSSDFR
jgi:hypothetical protein